MVFVIGTLVGSALTLLVLWLYRAWDRFSAEKVEPYGVQGKTSDVFVKRTRQHVDLPYVRPVVKQASIRSTGRDRTEV